jgi:hypothetical protein
VGDRCGNVKAGPRSPELSILTALRPPNHRHSSLGAAILHLRHELSVERSSNMTVDALTFVDDAKSHLFRSLRIYCRTSVIAVINPFPGCTGSYIPMLTTVLPGLVTMKFNTALGLIALGFRCSCFSPARRGRRTHVARFLGFSRADRCRDLSQYVGRNLGIDGC